MERTAAGAPRRACAPNARAPSRRCGRPQHPGAGCADPGLHRPAERLASAIARRFDAALKASPALPYPRIATAHEWRVFV